MGKRAGLESNKKRVFRKFTELHEKKHRKRTELVGKGMSEDRKEKGRGNSIWRALGSRYICA